MRYHEACQRFHINQDEHLIGWTNGDRIIPLPPGRKPVEWAYSPEWTYIWAKCPEALMERRG